MKEPISVYDFLGYTPSIELCNEIQKIAEFIGEEFSSEQAVNTRAKRKMYTYNKSFLKKYFDERGI